MKGPCAFLVYYIYKLIYIYIYIMYTLLYIALYSITLYYIILYCIVLYYMILYCIILYYFILYYMIFYYIILYYIIYYCICIYYVYIMCIICVYYLYILCILCIYIYIHTMCATVYASTSSTPCAWGTMIRKAQEIHRLSRFSWFSSWCFLVEISVCRQKPSGFWSIATGCELETMAQQ